MTITTTLISITSVALVGSILIFLVAMLVSVDRNVRSSAPLPRQEGSQDSSPCGHFP